MRAAAPPAPMREDAPSARFSDRLLEWRDRLLARPAFQRFAAANPLTRRIATREARALFDLCAGFVYSQVLSACVQLDLFEKLATGPRTLRDLAASCALTPEAMERLVRAAISLRLLEWRGATSSGESRIGLGRLGAALRGNPGVAAMVRHHTMLYADLADPVALLRTREATNLSRFWSYAGESTPRDAESVAAYSELMAASQAMIAGDILGAYPFQGHRRVLDIGGGEGAFAAAVSACHASLSVAVFDLPPVAARARDRYPRIEGIGGDFRHDSLPQGFDLITLVRIAHDHDDDVLAALLKKIHDALPPGGTLLIAEPMAGVRGAKPIGDAYFGLYLWAMGSGRARTPDEHTAFLRAAGFVNIKRHRMRRPMLCSAVSARRENV